MSWSVSFDETVDCCFVHWTGALDQNGLWSFARDVMNERWFHPGMNVLHDFMDATAAPPDSDVVLFDQKFHLVKQVFGDSGRVAILVPKQEDIQVAQTYVGIAGGTGREFKVFMDLDKAKEWLGLSADYVLPADR